MFRLPDAHRSSASSRQSRLHGAWGVVRAIRTDRSCRYRGEDGVTLIEVVVAFVLLLIFMLPAGVLITQVSNQAALARQHQAAVQLADAWIEILSNGNGTPPLNNGSVITNVPAPPTTTAGVVPPSHTIGGTNFTVMANYTEALVNNVGQSDLCANGEPPSATHPGVLALQITISWDNGLHSVVNATNLNYPQPGLLTDGFLAINLVNDGQTDKFSNSAVTRLEALPVTITQQATIPTLSPNPLTLYPDANGCIFAQVPVGAYGVSLDQPAANTPKTFLSWPGSPAFVTPSGVTSEDPGVQTVNVAAMTVVQMQAFDEGITTSISYGGASSVDGALTCPGAASLTCLVTGNGTSSATASWGSGLGKWTSSNVANTTNINQVACTSGSPATCVAVGDNALGAVALTTSTNLASVVADTLPSGVTDLTEVTCPSTNGCYAIGSSATGPVLVAAAVGQGSAAADKWKTLSLPSPAFTSMNSIACPTSSTCVMTGTAGSSTPAIIRLDGDPALLAGTASWAPTYSTDVLPTGVAGSTSVGAASCSTVTPTITTCLALATGDTAGATDPTVVTTTLASSGTDTWTNESTFPTGASVITQLACTSTTCVAIGRTPGALGQPAVWTADLTTSPHAWLQAQSIPPNVLAITSAACGVPDTGDTANCVFGVVTSNTSTPGQLLDGTLFGGSWAWNLVTPQVTSPIQYYLGVSCVNPTTSTNATCMAVGATGNGPVVVTTSTGPNGAWSAQTAPGGNGTVVSGIPLQTSPSKNTEWTTQVTTTAARKGNLTSLPNVLYPDSGGYSLATGDCSDMASAPTIASLVAIPGDTATAIVPLDLLTIQAVDSKGTPLGGATVTLTSTQCTGTDTFTMPVTDPAGFTNASVPYGTYTYLLTSALGITFPANGINLTLGGQTITTQEPTGSAVASYLPVVTQVHA